jgi:hypothetical protein
MAAVARGFETRPCRRQQKRSIIVFFMTLELTCGLLTQGQSGRNDALEEDAMTGFTLSRSTRRDVRAAGSGHGCGYGCEHVERWSRAIPLPAAIRACRQQRAGVGRRRGGLCRRIIAPFNPVVVNTGASWYH